MTAAKPTAAAKPADGDREPAGYPGLVWYNAGMVVAAATTMALYIIILVEGKGTLVMAIAEGKGTLVMAIDEGKGTLVMAIAEGKGTLAMAISEGKDTLIIQWTVRAPSSWP